jgi:hypothetical protein
LKIDGTLDLECAAWDRFAVAATYEPVGGVTIHRSIGALVDFLIKRRGTWWAHAGGTYDALAIAEEMRRRQIPCSIDLAGARISRLIGGGFVVRDSYPLVPLPLDVACGLAGEDPPELALACRCGLACGGYCSIRPNDPRRAVSDYCAADARALYRVLCAVRDVASDLCLSLRGTLGGTAWATARDMLDLPSQDLPPALWRTARDAYYGGRVTIVRPLCDGPGEHWDLSSAYPAALASLELPCGDWRHDADVAAELAFDRERPGIYGAVVRVPDDSFLPPLPIRQRGRLTYPFGRFRGAWCYHELVLAMERGVEVETIEWSITWSKAQNLFAGLIARWWDARAKAGKDTPLGRLLRLLCNSLPGKFAEAPDRRAARMFPSKIRHCNARRPCSIERCTGACGAWEQLDLWGQTWGVPFYRPSPAAHVQWGAYVTAETRGRWLEAAEVQGDQLVYGDTDSIWTASGRAPSPRGHALGEWELKHSWSHWECRAPRQYRYDNAAGATTLRTAGAKATVADWNRGEAELSRGVLTFNEAARSMERAPRETGLFRRRAQQWTLPTLALETGRYGDRLLDPRAGITYPLPYGE